MNKITAIKSDITDHWSSLGYQEWASTGLCPKIPPFKSIFNPSATHVQIYNILQRDIPWEKKGYFVIEKVYRHTDIGAVGDYSHLSFFYMFGAVNLIPANLPRREYGELQFEFINKVINFLNLFNFKKNDLIITYSKGGTILGHDISEDILSKEMIKLNGISDNNIIGMKGTSNFLYNPKFEIDIAGYRCDFYLKIKKRFIEIATLDFAEYLSGKPIIEKNNEFVLFGFYAGIERLLSINYGGNIWGIPYLRKLIDKVTSYLEEQYETENSDLLLKLNEKEIKTFVDRLRAICHIMAAGQKIDNTGRGNILKRLIQDIIRFFNVFLGQIYQDLITSLVFDICNAEKINFEVESITGTIIECAKKN